MGAIARPKYQAVRMSAGEQGCSYAAMLLHSDGLEVTEDKMVALLKAAGIEFESYWPGLYCKALGAQDLEKLISTPAAGGGGGGGPAGPAAAGGAAAGGDGEAAKEEEEEEEEMAPATNLFGDDGDDY